MFKQLKNMFEIDEDEDESMQEPLPLTLTQQTIENMKLVLPGTDQDSEDDQPIITNVDSYLSMQRKTQSKQKPKTKQELQKQRQFISAYGLGFKMLKTMGFNATKGLGKNQQGRTNIVQAKYKTSLTTKNQQLQQEQMKAQPEPQPPNQLQFTDLFKYKSRIPSLNRLIQQLKSKYQLLSLKCTKINEQQQRLKKEQEMHQTLKMQKQRECQKIDQQIAGLSTINTNLSNVNKYPHLGLKYNVDLMLVKQAVDKLKQKPIAELVEIVPKQLQQLQKTLISLFQSKDRQSINEYNHLTGIEKRFEGIFKKKSKQTSQNIAQITISSQDTQRINKYIRYVIEETVLNQKLNTYLSQIRSKGSVENFDLNFINLIEIICRFSPQIKDELKKTHFIPILNKYLKDWSYGGKKLPHIVVFPWLMIVKLDELDLSSFIYRVLSYPWQFESDNLINTISPWLKHLPVQHSDFFTQLYLSPKILYELESLQLTNPSSKNKIKFIIKHMELLPISLRQEIIENSLAITLLNHYLKQLKTIEVSNIDNLKEWVRRWEDKFNRLHAGSTIVRVFEENGVKNIW